MPKLSIKNDPTNIFHPSYILVPLQSCKDTFPGLPTVVVQAEDVIGQVLVVGNEKIPFLFANIDGIWYTEVNSAQFLFWTVTGDQAFDKHKDWGQTKKRNYFKKGGVNSRFQSEDFTDQPLPRGCVNLAWVPLENFVMVKIKTLKDLHKDGDLFIFFSEMLQIAYFGRFISRTVF